MTMKLLLNCYELGVGAEVRRREAVDGGLPISESVFFRSYHGLEITMAESNYYGKIEITIAELQLVWQNLSSSETSAYYDYYDHQNYNEIIVKLL